MKKKLKKISISIIIILLLIMVIFQTYVYMSTYKPSNKLDQYVSNTDYIYEDDMYIFEPKNKNNNAILLYNGALVDPYSYSYLAKLLSDKGYLVVIPKFFDNLSIFQASKGIDIINKYDEYNWYVMGHSLGGVSAASLLMDNNTNIKGIIFLASYPNNNLDLSDSNYKALSIIGSLDTVLNKESYNNTKKNLPKDTKYVVIEGGNHAYFGMYGEQKGDTKATITVVKQHEQVVENINFWIMEKK